MTQAKSLVKQLDAFDDWFGGLDQSDALVPSEEAQNKQKVQHCDLYASVAGGCYLEEDDDDQKSKGREPQRGTLSRKKSGALESMMMKKPTVQRSTSTGSESSAASNVNSSSSHQRNGNVSILQASAAARAKNVISARRSTVNVKTDRKRGVGAALDRFLTSSDEDDNEEPVHSDSGGSNDDGKTAELPRSASRKALPRQQRRSSMGKISEDEDKHCEPPTPRSIKKGTPRVRSSSAIAMVAAAPATPRSTKPSTSSSTMRVPSTPQAVPSTPRRPAIPHRSSSTSKIEMMEMSSPTPNGLDDSDHPATPPRMTPRTKSPTPSSAAMRVPSTPQQVPYTPRRRPGMPHRSASTTMLDSPPSSLDHEDHLFTPPTSSTKYLNDVKRETHKSGRRSAVAESLAEQLGLGCDNLSLSTSRHCRNGASRGLSRTSHGISGSSHCRERALSAGSSTRSGGGGGGGGGQDESSSSSGISRSLHMKRVNSVGNLGLGSRCSHGTRASSARRTTMNRRGSNEGRPSSSSDGGAEELPLPPDEEVSLSSGTSRREDITRVSSAGNLGLGASRSSHGTRVSSRRPMNRCGSNEGRSSSINDDDSNNDGSGTTEEISFPPDEQLPPSAASSKRLHMKRVSSAGALGLGASRSSHGARVSSRRPMNRRGSNEGRSSSINDDDNSDGGGGLEELSLPPDEQLPPSTATSKRLHMKRVSSAGALDLGASRSSHGTRASSRRLMNRRGSNEGRSSSINDDNSGSDGTEEFSLPPADQVPLSNGTSRSLHVKRVNSVENLGSGSRSSHGHRASSHRPMNRRGSNEGQSSSTTNDNNHSTSAETGQESLPELPRPRSANGLSRSRGRSNSSQDLNPSSHRSSSRSSELSHSKHRPARSSSQSAVSRYQSSQRHGRTASVEPTPRSRRDDLTKSDHEGGGGGRGSSRRITSRARENFSRRSAETVTTKTFKNEPLMNVVLHVDES
jgi:hypothetical protein